MAFPDIGHYTQRPVASPKVGGVGPGFPLSHLRSRIEIARTSFTVLAGIQTTDLDEACAPIPLVFAQDITVYSYWSTTDGQVIGVGDRRLDDDDWRTVAQVGFNTTEQQTLRDGETMDELPVAANWRDFNDIGGVITEEGKQESELMLSQPGNGDGIQRWGFGRSGATTLRPANWGGSGTDEWFRVSVQAETSGTILDYPHYFTVRYFVNKYMWNRWNNSFNVGELRTARHVKLNNPTGGIPTEFDFYAPKNFGNARTDLLTRPAQVKAGE